jgi:hypothetical protein
MSSPRFIVGTGRCGSTLLSSLLATHPSVLGVSELFSALGSRRFPEGTLTGSQLWAMLSEPVPAWTLALQRRLEPAEFLYPVDAGGRFDRRTGVPPIAAVCLPALTSEPDALYGKLEDVVPRLPAGRFGDVVGALLDWLAAQFDRTMWIERSGGSLAYAGGLASHFKDARFVHLHRSGPETALSMSRHPFFLMDVSRGFESLDPGALQPGAVSAERFAIRWSATILQGTSQLATLPRDRVYHAAYEDLLSVPPRRYGRGGSQRRICPTQCVSAFNVRASPDNGGWPAR